MIDFNKIKPGDTIYCTVSGREYIGLYSYLDGNLVYAHWISLHSFQEKGEFPNYRSFIMMDRVFLKEVKIFTDKEYEDIFV